jgi:hypothetical protein
MRGASTATAEIMVFRFMVETTILITQSKTLTPKNTVLVTHNVVASNKFKAEEVIARISETWNSSASAGKGPGSRGERYGGGDGRLSSGPVSMSLYGITEGLSACKRLMLIPMTTDETRREDAMQN